LSRIQSAILARLASGRGAFVPYLTAGFPDPPTTRQCALALARAGADVLELGVPFSDPIADGPVLERASAAALARGMTPAGVLELAGQIHEQSPDLPLVVMSYINPLMQFRAFDGGNFAESARQVGIDGVLVTDLPPEEPHELWSHIAAAHLDPIVLVSPTTDERRLQMLADRARGFVYCVSRLGVTGGGAADQRLGDLVRRARAATGLPALVGFGVTSGADAERAAALADGVVVGSALVERLATADPVAEAAALAREIVAGLARAGSSPEDPREEPHARA
jgi:tryptophan synthase alpha chain